MSKLALHINKDYTQRPTPKYSPDIPDLLQIGWIGQTGNVYALDDEPRDSRELGSYQPLLIQDGTWEYDHNSENYILEED